MTKLAFIVLVATLAATGHTTLLLMMAAVLISAGMIMGELRR